MRSECSRGFTLVEVLVALAVVAISLPALLFALSQQVDGTGYLRDKSLAALIASNRLEELRLVTAATRSVRRGRSTGQVEMAQRQWFWRQRIETTEVEQFYRVEITVAAREGEDVAPLATLVAFMMGDLRAASPEGTESGDPGEDNGGEG